MFWWLDPHTAFPFFTPVGLKPPWNQPQVMFLAFSRSPTFLLLGDIATVGLPEQSSNAGSGSPITVPFDVLSGMAGGVAPWVCPLTRLSAPGVEGPNVVLNELSLIEKCCA